MAFKIERKKKKLCLLVVNAFILRVLASGCKKQKAIWVI